MNKLVEVDVHRQIFVSYHRAQSSIPNLDHPPPTLNKFNRTPFHLDGNKKKTQIPNDTYSVMGQIGASHRASYIIVIVIKRNKKNQYIVTS